MSKDLTTSGPSRRSIAKGAAWAVPAVSVAAAAPSLAASPGDACALGASTLVVTVDNCSGITLLGQPPKFRLTNPTNATCTVPADTPVTVTTDGLASINLLGPDLANVGVLYSTGGTVALQNPIAPGKSVVINAFPPGINVTVLGSITLGVDDKSATMNLTANLIGGVLSVCRPS